MTTEIERVKSKLDEIIKRLERIESLLGLEEAFPEEDELEAILEYLKRKEAGKEKLIPLSQLTV